MRTYRVTCRSTSGTLSYVTVHAGTPTAAFRAAEAAFYANTRRDGALDRRLRVEAI